MMEYRVVEFRWLFGNALTIPSSFNSALILVKDLRVWDMDVGLRAHELCHVKQIERWGAVAYVLRHIWARVKSRNIFAWSESVESECYEAERKAREEEEEREEKRVARRARIVGR